MPNEQKENNGASKSLGNYAKFTGIAFQMIIIIGVMSFAGYEIDKHYQHHTQWVTAVLSLTGVFISLYIVIKSLKD
ncbi:AtpZ/AtpI family protein [Mucilaginibacter sp. KACC 22063]|uniref:AtpZ/AtpI family protein n=1 Tax=Mucilaginibacter sp. KACC 22063 TaxID=3025666 RepID=UPI002365BFBD|nr:AtpZ/AtpI family protein [Mucilaginibacter sp. KACC 22063]WDF56241.1 AtpZ/AtpI family protein [Mucilaginibacter sp. KACC 22063]